MHFNNIPYLLGFIVIFTRMKSKGHHNRKAQVIANGLSFFSYLGIGDIYTSYWIGATDIVEEGTYVWTDGTEVPMGAPFWGSVSIYLSKDASKLIYLAFSEL